MEQKELEFIEAVQGLQKRMQALGDARYTKENLERAQNRFSTAAQHWPVLAAYCQQQEWQYRFYKLFRDACEVLLKNGQTKEAYAMMEEGLLFAHSLASQVGSLHAVCRLEESYCELEQLFFEAEQYDYAILYNYRACKLAPHIAKVLGLEKAYVHLMAPCHVIAELAKKAGNRKLEGLALQELEIIDELREMSEKQLAAQKKPE